ncbi:hypothetical protein CEXT_44911 [Caerostris extrusa]|uniref:Uncharacterized protein n=1 Tax=Caerostris extrusa TaxID=172846 RepID=A0AAV4TQV0_CAEEX|nr:hypothetical protein CEXT_44911 [Caerostris extrusa]
MAALKSLESEMVAVDGEPLMNGLKLFVTGLADVLQIPVRSVLPVLITMPVRSVRGTPPLLLGSVHLTTPIRHGNPISLGMPFVELFRATSAFPLRHQLRQLSRLPDDPFPQKKKRDHLGIHYLRFSCSIGQERGERDPCSSTPADTWQGE